MASLTTRSENLDVLKTRRLIIQNVNGSYPDINTVPTVADSQGTIGFSTMTIDSSGNVRVSGSLDVSGSIITSNPGASTSNITITNTKPSISGTYDGTTESYLYLEPLGGSVSIGTLYDASGIFIPPSHTFEVNGNSLLRNGLVVEGASSPFTVDANGNMTLSGSLVVLPGGSITGSIDGSNVTGQTNVTALTISGNISGSQVIGDISGGALFVRDGGYVNTYLLQGTIPGSSIQGDISGNARSITGTINANQVLGSISGGANTVTGGYGAVLGSSVAGDICGGAAYIYDGGYVFADQIDDLTGTRATLDTATWYKGRIQGSQIISDLSVNAFSIRGTINGPTQIRNGVPANILFGDLSSNCTVNGAQISGAITNATMIGSQITGSINAGNVYGDLSNGYIRGDHISNDISGSLVIDSLFRATIPATQITYTDVSANGLNPSVFSSAMDVSSFVTPINLPSGCIYSLFARASDHPSNSIFATGYTDNTYNWFFTPTSNSPFDTVTYTLQPSSDHAKIIISPIPVSPLTFTLYYSLVSSVPLLFGNP
jgi:hypothetical protein